VPATCNAMGAGKWKSEHANFLRHADVVILPDNDASGRDHVNAVGASLQEIAKSVRVLELPGLAPKQDVVDWARRGGTVEQLHDLIAREARPWQPWEPSEEKSNEPSAATEPEELPPLPFINMANWDNEPVPEQEWAVLDRIPLGQTTLFTGEGGYGKSTVQLHLCAAHALGRGWLNALPELGLAIFFEAEDGEKTVHRRLAAIATHYETTFGEMIRGGLHVISLFGRDAVLATPTRNGKIEPTALYGQLLQAAGDIKPKMIGIASSANVFAGSEIDRTQTQQFVGLLNRIALVANGSVVLIAHPSLTGINTDTGLSGSTQWHNAVRARIYLKAIKTESGEQPDDDLRELVFKKNQFGPKSSTCCRPTLVLSKADIILKLASPRWRADLRPIASLSPHTLLRGSTSIPAITARMASWLRSMTIFSVELALPSWRSAMPRRSSGSILSARTRAPATRGCVMRAAR
jgi:hypothetical protein